MSDDPRLSALIKEGSTGEIVLIGYPFEHAALRMRRKGGEENGPCCLRRFYGKVGPLMNSEYQIDISNLNITDYGNIIGDPKYPSQLMEQLTTTVNGFLGNKQIPIVFGGSRETSSSTTTSFSQNYPKGKYLYFYGYPSVSRPYDNNKLASNSLFRLLPKEINERAVMIGMSEKYWPTCVKLDIKRIDIDEIRRTKLAEILSDILEPRTQMGSMLKAFLKNEEAEDIYVSISMDVIKNFMGTHYKPLEGLSNEEMLEVMLLLGRDTRVRCLDMTQFNPANEDYNSSLTILNMVYYFLMGYAKRGGSK